MSKPRTRRVVLIRCGQTDWDAEGRLAGTSDLPLSGDARASLTDHAGTLRSVAFGCVWSADDEASLETAAAVAGLPDQRAKVKKSDALREISLGLWEGSLARELAERCPSAFGRWCDDPGAATPPQGESLVDVRDRLVAECVRLLGKPRDDDQALVIVLRPVAWAVLGGAVTGLDALQLAKVSGAVGVCCEKTLKAEAESDARLPNDIRAGLIDTVVPVAEFTATSRVVAASA
ncbi:MAG: histidine phosphatase family protein [Planctomycetota bacterium]